MKGQPPSSSADYDLAEPKPAAMIESLRAFGYSLEAALADLIDNSITARAKNVWIEFAWDGRCSTVAVTDDGHGMSEPELADAMRLGNRDPLEARDARDLGRFGLGLKTASFSQCRRVVVLTRRSGADVVTRCWDLDYVRDSREWRLLKLPDVAPESARKKLKGQASGTTVLWQKLDRIVGDSHADDEPAHRRFLDALDIIKIHLGMVFHRFISEPDGLRLWLNGHLIKAWDPYLVTEPATQRLANETLEYGSARVFVQPYVLPHHSRIGSETHRHAAGPRGWNAQQGFYIYRNRRLLVAGDWLGLGYQKDEHFKLARIQIDFPNTMDADWDIDVKKARARPPGILRKDLQRIANATRNRAAEVYRHRGKVIAREAAADSQMFVWLKKSRHGKVHYEINREHPLVKEALKQSNGGGRVKSLLRLVEETVPVPFIVMNNAEKPDSHAAPFEHTPSKELLDLMKQVVDVLCGQGMSVKQACQRAAATEPFSNYPELLQTAFEMCSVNGGA